MANSWPVQRALLVGIALGAAFGVFLRFAFDERLGLAGGVYSGKGLVMSVAFLMLGPMAIGYLTVSQAERAAPRKVAEWIFVPWLPVALSMAVSAVLNLEGWICILFALPIAAVFASVGGVAAGVFARRARGRSGVVPVCIAILPLLVGPIEGRIHAPVQIRRVETAIAINASADRVWENIERVRRIERAELPTTWTQWVGFPRPVEATLSYEGVGGVRHASFEGGLLFIETVTKWEPNSVLRFSIQADTKQIPPTTLDEHVTIGGPYFDVLDGQYTIEPGARGVVLHLSSEERLSTDFNGYAGWWSDAVMRSIQESILQVLKQRCEAR